MKELPYFKFYPSQWIGGEIIYKTKELQGAYIVAIANYWNKECKMTYTQMCKRITEEHLKELISENLIIKEYDNISIDWLDKQFKERRLQYSKNVENGRKGGLKTQENKRESSDDKTPKHEKFKKDKYENDPTMRVSTHLKEILNK